MTLLKEPPDLGERVDLIDLRARLVGAAAEVTALLPALDQAVSVYREALAHVVALPADDAAFGEAFERFAANSGAGVLGAVLVDVELRIGAGLWGP